MITSRPCDLCEHTVGISIGKKNFLGIPTTVGTMDFSVHLVCCQRCGLVFQDPLQHEDKLRAYYANMFREEKCRPRQHIEKQLMPRIDFVNSFANAEVGHTILECGCADGTTLALFRKKGFTVFGIEPSMENAEFCRKKGIEVFEGIYEDFPIVTRRFEFVCNYYVMEHLRSPFHFLSFVNRHLYDGGQVMIEIPSIDAYKLEESSSNLLFFFEHQYHFNRETIELLLNRCGFKLLAFSEQVSHRFGMHLAAQKVSEPIPAASLAIPVGLHGRVMAEMAEYQAHLREKAKTFRTKVAHLLGRETDKQQKIVFFGASSYARKVLQLPEVKDKLIYCVVDNNSNKWGGVIEGIPIKSPSVIDHSIDLICVTSSYHAEITEQLHMMGIDKRKIIILQ